MFTEEDEVALEEYKGFMNVVRNRVIKSGKCYKVPVSCSSRQITTCESQQEANFHISTAIMTLSHR